MPAVGAEWGSPAGITQWEHGVGTQFRLPAGEAPRGSQHRITPRVSGGCCEAPPTRDSGP